MSLFGSVVVVGNLDLHAIYEKVVRILDQTGSDRRDNEIILTAREG